jgi:hypothetical protein
MNKRIFAITSVLLFLGLGATAHWLGLLSGGRPSDLMVEPARLDFGRIPAGTEATQLLIATNLGTEPVTVSAISAEEPFQALSSPMTLAPGQSQEIVVRFRSREPWQGEGALRITSAELSGGVREIPLLAEAHAPASIEVEPLSLSFGDVLLDGASKGSITIHNTGGDELRVESVATTAPFRPELFNAVVAPGESQTIEVSFEPTALGLERTDLLIASNDPERGTVTVRLDGTGVDHLPRPRVEVSPSALDFGKVRVGEKAETVLSIRNTGTDPLSVTNLVLLPPFSAPTRGREIPPGSALSLPVTFAPSSPGSVFAPLVIYSNAPSANTLTVGLLGEGILTAGGPSSGTSIAGGSNGRGSSSNGADGASGDFLGGTASVGAQGAGALGVLAAEGAAGEGAGADTLAALPSSRQDGPPTPPGVLEGSRVYLGTYESQISPASVGEVAFDASSGLLSLGDVQLPSVDAALGEYFSFSPTSGVGKVDLKGGEAQISLPVELLDFRGNKTPVIVNLTTGTATATIEGGTQISVTGKPVGPDGVATFVAAQTMNTGALQGMPMTFEIKVKVR